MRTLRAFLVTLVPAIALAQATINSSSPLPSGPVNVFYSTTLSCSNCSGFPWLVSAGSLPQGLNLDSVSGTINGTPTVVGTSTFTIELNTFNTPVFKNFSLTITGLVSINNTSFPNGVVNTAYPSQTLSASGGSPPYQWSTSGLPPGLGLVAGPTGTSIAGTPTSAGTYSFILTVFDSKQNSASMTFSITISAAGGSASITTTTLPNGVLSVPYSATLACANCSGYTWSLSSGTLPAGLSLNSQNGGIAGTPTAAGTLSFQVALTPPTSASNFPVATQNLSITIAASGVSITTTSLPVAFANTAYSTTLAAAGGAPPYTWALQSTANAGLTIGASTGILSGTPTATGQYSLNVIVTDSGGATATRGFSLTVVASLTILTTTLPNGTVNSIYPTFTLSAGGGQPPYRWTISTTGPGNLPPGLTLDGVFGRISGTPTTAGTYPFNVVVTDNQSATANATLSITVGGGITISPATLPAGTAGTAYSQSFTATGGTAPYTWSVPAGSVPPGLALNATTGVLSGTPTTAGTSAFTIQATDSTQAFGQTRYSVVIAAGPLSITTTSLPSGTVGTVYSQTLAAAGGTPPYSWSVTTGSLPAGLSLSATSGAITGTPTAAGTSAFTVTVTDAASGTAKQAFSITTAGGITVTPTTLPPAVVGVAYTQKFTATGGTAPYTFAITGTLPAGFTFAAATATISGTAPAVESGSFTLVVIDASARTASVPLTLTVTAAPITVTPTTLPAAVVGVAYTQKLTASGGTGPYTFAITLGALPSGFTFAAATGTISGTAPAAESGNFTVTVTDSAGAKLDVPLSLTATNPPTPTVTVTLSGPTSGFLQQLPVGISIGTAYPLNISGALSLTFAPSVTPAAGVADGMIQFASGGTTLNFTIPAGSTTPVFASGANPTVLTGTTAGTITVITSLTVNGVALNNTTKTIVNASGVPFISSVAFTQTPGGVTVTVVGFSSTREMVSGLFHFAPASNVTFTQSDITVPLTAPFTTWWSNTAQSNPFGTQFTLTVPFTLSTQSTAVVSVTVTLTNSKGASNAVTLSQ